MRTIGPPAIAGTKRKVFCFFNVIDQIISDVDRGTLRAGTDGTEIKLAAI